METGRTEKDLIDKLNAGEESAFESVFHLYYPTLCFFANKFIQDEESSRDIVQDVFVWCYEKKPPFETLIAVKSFLYSCVYNKSINHLEKSRTQARIREKIREISPEAEEKYEEYQIESEVFEEIFLAIEALPEACRKIFKMSYIDGMDIKSITRELQVMESTVKTQRQRAKKILRERLKHLYPLFVSLFLLN